MIDFTKKISKSVQYRENWDLIALNKAKNRENTETDHENVLKIGWKWKNKGREIVTYKVLPPNVKIAQKINKWRKVYWFFKSFPYGNSRIPDIFS